MLDYEYIMNHDRLIAIDLSRNKELEADLKAIQKKEFIKQLKNLEIENADGTQNMIVLMTLGKIK